MRDYLKRLDRLASAISPDVVIPRCVVRFVESDGSGHAKPWMPRWARSYVDGKQIERSADESPEAFEMRATAEIPGIVLMGCGADLK